jgi:type II secretory pathway component PulF
MSLTTFVRGINVTSIIEDIAQAFRRLLYFGLAERVELYYLLAGLSRAKQALPAAIAAIAAEQLRQKRLVGRALYAIQRPLRAGKSFEASFRPWVPADEATILAAADRNAATEAFTSLATISSALREITLTLAAAISYPVLLAIATFTAMNFMYTELLKPSALVMDYTQLQEHTQLWIKIVTICATYPVWIGAAVLLVAGSIGFSFPRVVGRVRNLLDRHAPPFIIYREISAARFLLTFVGLQMAKTSVSESLRLLTSNASKYMRSHLEPMLLSAMSGRSDVATFRSPLLDPSTTVALSLLLSTPDAESALPRLAETLLDATKRRVNRIAKLIVLGGILVMGAFLMWTLLAYNDFGNVAANPRNATSASP